DSLQPDHRPRDETVHQGHALLRERPEPAGRRLERPAAVEPIGQGFPARRPAEAMSAEPISSAPGCGALLAPDGLGVQPVATGNGRIRMCRHDCTYVVGSTALSFPR